MGLISTGKLIRGGEVREKRTALTKTTNSLWLVLFNFSSDKRVRR